MEEYLREIYEHWCNKDFTHLLGNLPIGTRFESQVFVPECPPIPWLGNIQSSVVFISLEPKLNAENGFEFFDAQIQQTNNLQKWKEFYPSSKYFERYYDIRHQHLYGYWETIALIARGYITGNEDIVSKATLLQTLTDNVVEFPFIQYHANNHPRYRLNSMVINDFIKRLHFLKNQQVLFFYGKGTIKKLKMVKESPFRITKLKELIHGKLKSKIDIHKIDIVDRSFIAVSIPQRSAGNNMAAIGKIQLGNRIQTELKNIRIDQ